MEIYMFVLCLIYKVTLGTNPICLAAPAKDGDDFVLDMATTSVALGKVNCSNYLIYFQKKNYYVLNDLLPSR